MTYHKSFSKEELIKNSKILIVDDVSQNLQVIGSLLKSNGFHVALANNGTKALTIAQSRNPDLILLDIQMPEMDGFKVCELLKNSDETKEIPVIFLTALNNKKDILKGFEAGGVDYITKPFNQQELIARIINHLELRHSKVIIENQNRDLVKSNLDKDKFLSIIAHDLKSPFSGLLGISEIIANHLEELTPIELKEYTNSLYDSLKSQFKFLEELLEWGRYQRGTMQFNPRSFNIIVDISDSIGLLRSNADTKHISVGIDVDEDLIAYYDSNMVYTILRNLVSNAIKFTPSKGSICISAKLHESNNNFIVVSVLDSGVGMTEDEMARLFRIDSVFTKLGTNNEKGTGLGLILCKEFAERHGGTIWVESAEGEGSKFSFTLPANEL
jgi:two-component system, sensor histidine kinase and response regulator